MGYVYLVKSKYIKRWRGKAGKYHYQYTRPTDRTTNTLNAAIKKGYDWIFKETDNKFEACVVLTADGQVIGTKKGGNTSIEIGDMESILKDSVFLHNHPLDCSFSIGDVICALTFGMREIRAVGDNYEYIYKPAEYLPKGLLHQARRTEVAVFWHKADANIYSEYDPKVKSGEVSIEYATLNHHHELMTKFVKRFGGSYERRKR